MSLPLATLRSRGGRGFLLGFLRLFRLDCVVLDERRGRVVVYIMKPSEGRYAESRAVASCPAGHEILGAIMSDFDHDGYADILLMHKKEGAHSKMELSLFLGDGESLRPALWPIEPAIGQVSALDFDGSMQLALLGVLADDKTMRPAVWRSQATSPNEISSGYDKPVVMTEFGKWPKNPYIIQADFDGDGQADLLFTYSDTSHDEVEGFEIWSRLQGDHKVPYQLALRRKLPPGTGPITVADVDGDGHLDIVFAVCNPPDNCVIENSIHIMYNVQRRYCSGSNMHGNCREVDKLFAKKGEEFEFQGNIDSANHMVIDMAKLFPDKDVRVLFHDPILKQPISMSVGDFDLDSYPDLAIVIGDRKRPENVESARASLLRSVKCTPEQCKQSQVIEERRTFEQVTKQVEALTNLTGVAGVAFADWYDLGPPGFLVNYYDKTKMRHLTIRNGISRDAFSLRAETLNGVCPAPCRRISTGSRAERPLSVNYIGASYRFAFVDDLGATQVRSGTQMGQTINNALQSPTVLFGLGRTSNFVQTMEVGINLRNGPNLYTKTNIFPNSEVVFSPPHADSGTSWRAELQIHPSEYIIYVITSMTCALIVLVIITGIFKYQEKREDDIERKRATHLINFDAL